MTPETFNFIKTYTHASSEWLGDYFGVMPRHVATMGDSDIDPIIAKKMYEFYGVFEGIVLETCKAFIDLRCDDANVALRLPVFDSAKTLKSFTDTQGLSHSICGHKVTRDIFSALQYATKATLSLLYDLDVTLLKYDPVKVKDFERTIVHCPSNPNKDTT